jgi:hypothetical protein
LIPALRGQPVKLGSSIIFGNAFFRLDPASLNESVKGWIERASLNEEYIFRIAFDRLGDGMTVQGTQQERPEYE